MMSKATETVAERIPSEIVCAQHYEDLAGRFVEAPTLAYIAGGSAHDVTLQANRDAFDAYALTPRVLQDVDRCDTVTRLPGTTLSHPVLLAPVAMQGLVHPDAERATARGAAAVDACLVASTLSSLTLEEIAAHSDGPRWFQLYFQPQRRTTLDLLRRAEAAGYQAIVVTLDATLQAPSHRALRAGFRLPPGVGGANLAGAPADPGPSDSGSARVFARYRHSAPTTDDLAWLLSNTHLPVFVKGVLHPDDARRLQALGVAGVVVSNHGGRTLDGAPASLHMLPRIRLAVGDGFPLLFDSGIRSGGDAFKAIALGADAVLLGRLQVYALAAAGALGVAHLVRLLREELELCMAMSGCADLAAVRATRLEPVRMQRS